MAMLTPIPKRLMTKSERKTMREDIAGIQRGVHLPPGKGPSNRSTNRLGVFVFAALLIGGSAAGVNIGYAYFDLLMSHFPATSPLAPYYFGVCCIGISILMYWVKGEFLYQYSWAEIGFAFGCMVIAWKQYHDTSVAAAMITLVGAIYVAVRGFENRAKALKPPDNNA